MIWVGIIIILAFVAVGAICALMYFAEDVTEKPQPVRDQWGRVAPPPVFQGSPRVVALAQALYPRLLGTMFTITTTPTSVVIQTRRENVVREYADERETFDEERVVILHDRPDGFVREDRVIRRGIEQGPQSTSRFTSGFMGKGFRFDFAWEVWRDERGRWVKRKTSGPNLDLEISKAMEEAGVKFAPFKFREQDIGTKVGCVAAILGASVPVLMLVISLVR